MEKAKDGSARAGRGLVEATGSPDRERSLAAYNALVGMGEGSERWLLEGLRSDNAAVAEACAAALGNMRSTNSVPALVHLLERDGGRPYAAALALGEIGDPAAVPHLVNSLSSPNIELRKASVRALVKMGPELVTHLLPLLDREDDRVGQRAAIRVVGELRASQGVNVLTAVTGPNRDVAVWALGRVGDMEGTSAVLAALSDERWPVRREAAEALGNLEDPVAVPALTAALEDPEAVVREWAARSLEVLTGEQVLYRDEEGELVPPYNLYR